MQILLFVDPPSSRSCNMVSSYSFVQQSTRTVLFMMLLLDTVFVQEQPYKQFENAENVGEISQNLAREMDNIK